MTTAEQDFLLSSASVAVTDNYVTSSRNSHDDVTTTSLTELAAVRFTFIALYVIIFVVGISGNSLVVYVIMRNKAMQTITNLFIVNLALSDILMCLLAVPFTPLSAFDDDWFLGEALCRIVPMSLGTTVYVSTLTSTGIAIDR